MAGRCVWHGIRQFCSFSGGRLHYQYNIHWSLCVRIVSVHRVPSQQPRPQSDRLAPSCYRPQTGASFPAVLILVKQRLRVAQPGLINGGQVQPGQPTLPLKAARAVIPRGTLILGEFTGSLQPQAHACGGAWKLQETSSRLRGYALLLGA